jgi:hypothetical protein
MRLGLGAVAGDEISQVACKPLRVFAIDTSKPVIGVALPELSRLK